MNTSVSEETENAIGNTRFNTSKYAIHRQIEDSQDEQFSKERQHPCYITKLPSHTARVNVGVVVSGGTSGNHRHGHGISILIQTLITRCDTSPAQIHHYCKVLEKLIAEKRQGNKDRYTASSSRLI